jgi:nucleotide-binding universal stress UspA family protein
MSAMLLSASRPAAKLVLHETPKYSAPKLRILCATDLSPRSEPAIERALRLAHTLSAECMLLHVVSDDVALRIAGRRAERGHTALQWHVRQFASLKVDPKISVRVGDPYETIARAASDWDAHLIVLGTQRRRSIAKGRTSAERISHRVRRPVLIVNSRASREYSSVMFAAAKNVGPYVQLADQLAMLDTAHVSVVPHVGRTDRAALFISRRLGSRGSKLATALQHRMHRRMQTWIEEAGLHLLAFEIVSRPTKPRALLARLTKKAGPQLLVVPAKRTALFGSNLASSAASIALRTSACDVLLGCEASTRSALLSPDLQSAPQPQTEGIDEVAIA